jgi:hypothetical protein
MLKRCLRVCRSHPIATAAILGAVFGAGNVIATEIGAVAHLGSGGVLPLLWSSSVSRSGQLNPAQVAALLLIDVSANILAFGLLFAAPVALFVAMRRIFATSRRPSPDSEPAPPDHP